MSDDFARILAELQRNREKLDEVVRTVADTREEREELFRAVERLRSRLERDETKLEDG